MVFLLGGLLVAGTLAGCGPTGPNSALQSARRACGVIEGSQFYPRVPLSGIYVGVDTATRVERAIARSGDPTLTVEMPAMKRASRCLPRQPMARMRLTESALCNDLLANRRATA
jgi:hypothetical protein